MLARSILLATLVLSALLPVRADEPVVLLHWNDLHGQVLPRRSSDGSEHGGFRGLAALVEGERARSGAERVLLLDAGDWFQGTPEGNIPRGRAIVELMNAIGVDAAAIGNHEFDFGVQNLRELIELARFPALGANVLEPDGVAPVAWAERSVVIERGGIRFGIVGVVTEETSRIVRSDVAEGLAFADAAETVRREIPHLRERGAELIVVLSHLGHEPERALAAAVPGIDLIVGGHSHTLVPEPWIEPTTGTVVVQAESNATHLGRLEIVREGGRFAIRGGVIPVPARAEPVSPAIEEIIARYRPEVDGPMAEVVGSLDRPLVRPARPSPDPALGRRGWHPVSNPLGSWVAGEMARVAGTEIALQNRGGVRADLPAGAVTRRDLFQVSPFGNTVVVCSLSGAELRDVIETSLADPRVRLDVHGLRIGWRHGDDFGPSKRLVSLEAGGLPLEEDRLYTVATNNFLAYGGDGWTQFRRAEIRDTGVEVYEATVRGLAEADAAEAIELAIESRSYVQIGTASERAVSAFGLVVLLGLAWLLSTSRRTIPWRPVLWGIALQAVFAVIILRTGPGLLLFDGARAAFQLVLDFSAKGANFVFGPLGDVPAVGAVFPGRGFIFAFQVAATIIFVSATTAILYHLGVMQVIVYLLAKGMQLTMRTSGAESLAAAANIFVGQTEAPLVVRPYLGKFTASETMALMTSGMATIAGGVLAAYVGMGIDAGHLLAASVMSAPAALAIAKLMVPESEKSATAADVPFAVRKIDRNILDAACRGASDGLKLALNVMAMLIAFIALVALVDWAIGAVHGWFLPAEVLADPVRLAKERLDLGKVLGYLFAPIAWLLGVPSEEIREIGTLLGIKIALNEFVAYIELSKLLETLSPRSATLATYALCGFANFSSIAIQIGGISALEEGLRPSLARLGLRAMIGGTLAALMTACIAGALT